MVYAIVAIGAVIFVKYLFPFLDNLFELFSMFLAKKANSVNIEMEIAKFKAEQLISPKSPAIGFCMDEDSGCTCNYDDEDDEDEDLDDKASMKGKIGFRL